MVGSRMIRESILKKSQGQRRQCCRYLPHHDCNAHTGSFPCFEKYTIFPRPSTRRTNGCRSFRSLGVRVGRHEVDRILE